MIIIWRGNGIIALIPLMSFPIAGTILAAVLMNYQHRIARRLPFFDMDVAGVCALTIVAAATFTGGLICYRLGKSWNRNGDYHEGL